MRHIDRPEAGFDEVFDAGYEPLEDAPYEGATFGAAFFGWLVASAVAVLVVALIGVAIAATGTVVGWDGIGDWSAAHADETALLATVLVLLTLTISQFAGGYVGGRMVHTGGAKQGFGVWLLGLLAAAALTGMAYVANRLYHLTGRIDFPSWITTPPTAHPRAGLIAALLVFVVALVAAIAGGVAGNRYHRRLSRPPL